jgi:cell division septation protein DedD
MNYKIKNLIFVFALLCSKLIAQETDIVSALREIENGNIKNAEIILQNLKMTDSGSPSVIFLDAVLTKNGEDALKKYSVIVEKYPQSKYADASLYRIFSYYYSLGYYKKAEASLDKLKKDFPASPYIKTADRKIPDDNEQTISSEEKKPAEQIKVAETKASNFLIQAGAFMNVDNAKNLIDNLKKENLSAEISTKEIGGSILNVVTISGFAAEEDAKSVLSLLEKKFNLKGRVVSSKN